MLVCFAVFVIGGEREAIQDMVLSLCMAYTVYGLHCVISDTIIM